MKKLSEKKKRREARKAANAIIERFLKKYGSSLNARQIKNIVHGLYPDFWKAGFNKEIEAILPLTCKRVEQLEFQKPQKYSGLVREILRFRHNDRKIFHRFGDFRRCFGHVSKFALIFR